MVNLKDKTMQKRILMSLLGVIICSVSVGGFKHSRMGVDPFQSVMSGVDSLIPLSFGTLYVIVNALLLSFSLTVDRTKIGIATFLNLFLSGYMTQFSLQVIEMIIPSPVLWVRVVMLLVSVIVMCFGSALYITANLGVSTYDAIALVMAEKWKIAKFKYCRIGTDLVCVILGVLLYLLSGKSWRDVPAIAGIGTIITAFMMGPLVEWFNEKVARPMLYGKNK